MLTMTIAGLSLLTIINYHFSQKRLLYPATVFCFCWSVSLFLAWLVGDFFYPFDPSTLAIFIFGAFAFSVGSALAMLHPSAPKNRAAMKVPSRVITLIIWVIVLGFPLYILWMLRVVSSRDELPFLMAARMNLIDLQGSAAFTVYGLFVELSTVISLIAFHQRDGHKLRAFFAISTTMLICLLTGTKGAPLFLTVGLLGVNWFKTGRIGWKAVLVTILIFASVFVMVESYVHIHGVSIAESAVPIVQNGVLYSSGSLIALDRIVRDPKIVPVPNPVYDTILRVLRRFFGLHVEVSEPIPKFINIGPYNLITNDYTIYGAWFSLGHTGMVAAMCFAGFLVGLIYKRATSGGWVALTWYSMLLSGLVFSPLSDYLSSLFVSTFVVGVAWMIYCFPVRWASFRQFCSGCVNRDFAHQTIITS